MMRQFHTFSPDETRRVAQEFAGQLQRGDIVTLYGELGSGKTQFVKGICDAFGATSVATSPTFVLFNSYSGYDAERKPLPIYHFDLYRITSNLELYDIGYEEFFYDDGISCVEWAEHLGELLPHRRYDVMLKLGDNENERFINIQLQEQ
ncbi:MAG: tRNA (adenosine(37)-N6)-threonylcarbamoyltransferase complex ATPase subunit type 1 TsaE [Bacteroidetes bacterium]|nr:tRNA (adenosine(37)-N6)-threonylcarbamoyltransferase complex ATPase subunit type 1 TsaE [Bacteroidota bacterium]